MPILFTNVRAVSATGSKGLGVPFLHRAPYAGCALVGLRLGYGVSSIEPIFAELLDDGTMLLEDDDTRAVSPLRRWIEKSPLAKWSRSHDLHVAKGCVVTGIQIRGGRYINGIRLHQTPWDGTLKTSEGSWTLWWRSKVRRGGTDRPKCFAETREGAVVIGIEGRADLFVSELSIVTANVQRVAAMSTRAKRVAGEARGMT
jgi:hypothetical protein